MPAQPTMTPAQVYSAKLSTILAELDALAASPSPAQTRASTNGANAPPNMAEPTSAKPRPAERLLEAAKEMAAIAKGEAEPAALHVRQGATPMPTSTPATAP
jgi:hypothetical protein